MQVNTGHLINTEGLSEQELNELRALGYFVVPPELNREARRALKGEKQTHVSVKNQTPLAKFAEEKRLSASTQAKKRKQRRKMAKESRQRNRVR